MMDRGIFFRIFRIKKYFLNYFCKKKYMWGSLLFISGQELVIVFIIVLLLFGSKGIPEIAKGIGKGMREFKKATDEIKTELRDSSSGLMDDINQIKRDITKDTQEVVNTIKKDIDYGEDYNAPSPEKPVLDSNPMPPADEAEPKPSVNTKTYKPNDFDEEAPPY
jgi:sec-independent protein translocase protein TatA